MTWKAKIILENNTPFNINIINNSVYIGVTSGTSTYTYITEELNNLMNLKFWEVPNNYFLESIFSFSQNSPSYINRGTLSEQSQDIKLTVKLDSQIIFEQVNNTGGMNFLFDLFANGKSVTFIYDMVTVALENKVESLDA